MSCWSAIAPMTRLAGGGVLSDETLTNLQRNDPVSAAAIRENFAYWDDIALHHKGRRLVSSGHGFCGIGRQQRARELDIDMRFETEVESASELMRSYDLVVAGDGLNSTKFAIMNSLPSSSCMNFTTVSSSSRSIWCSPISPLACFSKIALN